MNIAINGFGRIGRLFFRQAFEVPGINIVAINDLGNLDNLAYLLRYDSVYGHYAKEVSVDTKTNTLVVDGKPIRFIQEKEITQLPWKELQIDIAVESTGFFESFEKSRGHVVAGARRAVITAPAKDEEQRDARTILNGVNEELFAQCVVTSNGSCTTNSVSPVIAILAESIGIEKAMMTTVHGYTATQRLVDGPDAKDWRRGRAAAVNIVPSTTGAAVSVTRAITALTDRFDGIAMRVPVPAGSLSDMTLLMKRDVTVEEINILLEQAAISDRWKDVFRTSRDPLVSSDIVGEAYGSVADLTSTKVVGGNLLKVLAWYDNEWGYVKTLVEHVKKVGNTLVK